MGRGSGGSTGGFCLRVLFLCLYLWNLTFFFILLRSPSFESEDEDDDDDDDDNEDDDEEEDEDEIEEFSFLSTSSTTLSTPPACLATAVAFFQFILALDNPSCSILLLGLGASTSRHCASRMVCIHRLDALIVKPWSSRRVR